MVARLHITNPNWLLLPVALAPGPPSLPRQSRGCPYQPFPNKMAVSRPQKETREKGWSARVAWSWAPLGPLSSVPGRLPKGPLTLGKIK